MVGVTDEVGARTMAKAAKKVEISEVEVMEIHTHQVTFNIVGISPMIMHRFDQKAWRELLLPSQAKNRAEKAMSLKHDPIAEFRGALYLCRNPNAPTAIHVPSGSFHNALGQAAIDIPGAAKSEIKRLTTVVDETVHLYGMPLLGCHMVRNSGINGAPDVRTRPIFREWACQITFKFIADLVKEKQLLALLAAAGHIVGIGDWRGQKGGPFGRFRLCSENDPDFTRITKHQGRFAQLEAIEHPEYFDEDSRELLAWFFDEVERREKSATFAGNDSTPKKIKKAANVIAAE